MTRRKKEGTTRTCEVCGKTLIKRQKRFCSNKCRGLWACGENNPAWAGGKVKIICGVCGKEREFFPSRAKEQRFCSEKCKGIWWAEQQKGENNTCWRNAKSLCICERCGKEFEEYVYDATPWKFCSKECHLKSLGGSNNPNWRGGRSFEPYPITFNEEFKRKIRQRDHHQCAICWLFGKDVHHINYIKEDTVPENCITLCKTCHVVTNFNRDHWQLALGNLQQIRLAVQKNGIPSSRTFGNGPYSLDGNFAIVV